METLPSDVWWIGAAVLLIVVFVLWRGGRVKAKMLGAEVEADGMPKPTTEKAKTTTTPPNVGASGSGSIAVGGNVSDSAVVSVSHNRVTSIKGDRSRID